MQVLVVDDDPAVRQSLAQILQRRGHQVQACGAGDQALAAYRTTAFPLVLLDLKMPGTSGQDTCRAIRQLPGGADAVIVVITACDRQADLQAVLDAGASDYLTKPVDFRLLDVRLAIAERQVESAQTRRRMEAQLREAFDRFDLASRGSNDGIWDGRADKDGNWNDPDTYVWYSPRFKEILGYRDEEFPDTLGSWLLHLHPDDRAAALSALEDHLERRVPFDVTYRLQTKSGTYRWIRGIGQATWDERGRPVRMAGSIRDVTGRLQLDNFRTGQLRMFSKLIQGASVRDLLDTLAETVETQFDDAHCMMILTRAAGKLPTVAAPSLSAAQIEQLRVGLGARARESTGAMDYRLEVGTKVGKFHVAATVPIIASGDQNFGSLVIMMPKARALADAETHLLEIAAHLAAGIVQRRKTEQALRASEERWRSLVANAPDFILIVDAQRNILFINHVAAGFTRDEVQGRDLLEYVMIDEKARLRDAIEHVFATGRPAEVEVAGAGPNGSTAWYATRLGPITEGGRVVAVTLISTDITIRRQMEQKLRNERQLLKQLLDLQERDRKVTAYEIHDGIVQDMAAAQMHLETYRDIRKTDAQRAEENLTRSWNLVRASVAEGRRLINGLRPPILDELGVVAAVEHLVDETRREISEVEFVHELDQEQIPPPLENAVFRIVQEALANVRHHSQASHVRVELTQAGDRLHIKVRDWGIGFDPRQTPGERFGLRGIRERSRLLGGKLSIHSAPGRGAEILVDLPLYPSKPT